MINAISGSAASGSPLTSSNPETTADASNDKTASADTVGLAGPTIHTSVNISVNGQAQAWKQAHAANDDSDIENSGLNKPVQQILKQIRKLERELQEKIKELQDVMADKSLSPKARDQKVSMLRAEISSLQSSINDAKETMNQVLSASRATTDERALAMSLAHP
jgi:chromosome segregation ATPase